MHPGNPGIAQIADLVPISVDEIHRLADFATELKIDLTVVGPELPLSLGIVDEFESRGLRIFGPRQAAAQLESSKVFAKDFMIRHDIPTARSEVVHDEAEARKAIDHFGFPVVLKADGLAAGKGVLILQNEADLEEAMRVFYGERRFGASADTVLVEEFLEGEEVSFMGLCDGKRILTLATSKDYKRIGDGDSGANTGGMGAHSPAGVLGSAESSMILEEVLKPTIQGMEAEGVPFVGVLYAGLMMTENGPQVLEFNARFGDPECQPIMMRLENDLAPLLYAGAGGDFGVDRLTFRRQAAACVVLASRGYPEKPITGDVIQNLDAAAELEDVQVFHSGTRQEGDDVISAGGRVLTVCALGTDLRVALRKAYVAANTITWENRVFRTDIGRRVVEAIADLQDTGSVRLADHDLD